jgi:hypothetical protein
LSAAHRIIACDPGLGGYFAILDVNTFTAEFYPIPVTYRLQIYTSKSGEKKVRRCRKIDSGRTKELVQNLAKPDVAFVVLEHQQAYPRQGVVSTGKTLYGYGLLEGLLISTPVTLEVVRAATWKRALGLIPRKKQKSEEATSERTYQKKCRAWQRALDLFPELQAELTPKSRSFDKCEALLLCYYGLQCLSKKHGLQLSAADSAFDTDPVLL